VHYLQSTTSDGGSNSADRSPFTTIGGGSASAQAAPLLAASGDVEGNGASNLVIRQTVPYGQGERDEVEVYRVLSGQQPQLIADLAAFDNPGASNGGDLVVGDVDPSEPGDEIVVSENGDSRQAARLQVFGGLARGALHLLYDLTALPQRTAVRRPLRLMRDQTAAAPGRAPLWRGAARGPLHVVLGKVFPDSLRLGTEIVVGTGTGDVYVYGFQGAQGVRLLQFAAFPDAPRSSALKMAVGDVLPSHAADEIIVADDGTRGDGLVRIFDGQTGTMFLEFEAFESGAAPAGVEVWAADVIAASPGAELIAGQGSAGGRVRIFTIDAGIPKLVVELPDPLHRATSLGRLLAVGDLLPGLPGNEIALAQPDPHQPVEVFHVTSGDTQLSSSVDVSAMPGPIRAIAVGQ